MPGVQRRRVAWGSGVAVSLTCVLAIVVPDARAGSPAGDDCLSSPAPSISEPERPIRFGITPLTAGSVGSGQLEPKPENRAAASALLNRLRPQHRELVMRLNRMFWADGVAGIRRYGRIVDRYAREGLDSELQVRYHPPAGAAGDMRAWRSYVRTAVRILGRRPGVRTLSITNEANFDVSPNTSDGSYPGVREAVIEGIVAADRELRRIGRRDIELGFSFAWRWIPASDRSFWEEIGRRATPEFRRALDYVGLQTYPYLVWPPMQAPGRTAGDEVIEALTLLRNCYMPKAALGRRTDVWVSENGYATNLGRSEAGQRQALRSTIAAVSEYSGELGVSDYRWFNLRDNNSTGPDLFDAVGVLGDDYSPKPAFATLRRWIERIGTRPGPEPTHGCRGRPATVVGTPDRDRLRGTPRDDVIVARRGRDRVHGRGGDDLICGGRGSDRLDGGSGSDRIYGGPGRDRCRGRSGTARRRGCER